VLQPPAQGGAESGVASAGATCVTCVRTNSACCVAGYRPTTDGADTTLGYQFDVETGQPVVRFAGAGNAGINKFLSLPHMPIVAAAHCDGCIRLHDLRTGACVHTHNAIQVSAREQHWESDSIVTSLCADAAGTRLYSSGHDGILRTWSLAKGGGGQDSLLHEQEIHPQRKWDEAVHCLAFRPETSLLAAGGADALVNVLKVQPVGEAK
jgi:striatin 1/3/4